MEIRLVTLTLFSGDHIGGGVSAYALNSLPRREYVDHWVYLGGNKKGQRVGTTDVIGDVSPDNTRVRIYPIYKTSRVTVTANTKTADKIKASDFKTVYVPACSTVGEVINYTGPFLKENCGGMVIIVTPLFPVMVSFWRLYIMIRLVLNPAGRVRNMRKLKKHSWAVNRQENQ